MLKEERTDVDVLEQLPYSLRQQLTFERFHLHKPELFQNRSRDPAFDPKYFPQNCGAVPLPCYWIERRHLYVFGAQSRVSDELSFFSGDDPTAAVLFPIHPANVAHYQELLVKLSARDAARDGLRIWGVPTSSTRTFLAWPDQRPERALFVKLSLHSPIFGDRRLHTWKIARSVGLSSLVQASLQELPGGLGFFSRGAWRRSSSDAGRRRHRSFDSPADQSESTARRTLVRPDGRSARPAIVLAIDGASASAATGVSRRSAVCEVCQALVGDDFTDMA